MSFQIIENKSVILISFRGCDCILLKKKDTLPCFF